MVKKILNGMLFGSGICIVIGVFMLGIYFVKGSDPLTATDGDTLTAANWNALVDKAGGKVYVSDWFDVSILVNNNFINRFNTYTINHNLGSDNVDITVFGKITDDGEVFVIRPLDMYRGSTDSVCYGYSIRNILQNSLVLGFPRDYCDKRYLFNSVDTNTTTSNYSTGKIKVMVRAY
ncbi:MAG: hypothetical protein V3575_04985 [Candidatus Absconditabacteria bacterium]